MGLCLGRQSEYHIAGMSAQGLLNSVFSCSSSGSKPSQRGSCTRLAAWILRWSETARRLETPAVIGHSAPQLDLLTAKALQKASLRTPDSNRVFLRRACPHLQTLRRSPVFILTTEAANAARPGIYLYTSLVLATSSHRESGFKESCLSRMLFRTISVNLR